MQNSIFDLMYSKYKITKPSRLIEFFAGYGSQALALKYLDIPFEHWKTCEWAVKSIQAYKDIHFNDDNIDYSRFLTKDDLVSKLNNYGISSNYNEPMTYSQIKRLNEKQLRNIFNNIVCTHNLVNIQNVKGEDLEIKDTSTYTYLLTYSFPCQDLSLAGNRMGMSDTSTRSGMLWEVERILDECKELGNLPEILLMENVTQVHGADNVKDFNKWQLKLEQLGYRSYWQDLIATDYGIPQTRNRCFMVSILGDYSYSFPKPLPLKIKLKNMLEENVDEKYFLSERMIKGFLEYDGKIQKKDIFLKTLNQDEIAKTLTCGDNTRVTDNYILIKNNNSKGYIAASDGDGIDISSRMQYHRGTVQKNKTQTITTMGGENNGVVVEDKGNYYQWYKKGYQEHDCRAWKEEKISETLCTKGSTKIATNSLRIRKLIPSECFALMGVKKEDYLKCAKNQSDSSLYHLAGDSIVVNVLMAIFREMM